MRIHSPEIIRSIKKLRQHGHSIPEIVRLLSIPKTTVWYYTTNVLIARKYRLILQNKQSGSRSRSQKDWLRAKTEAHEVLAREGISNFSKILIAVSLYWGEGSKRDFNLANSDPLLVRTFMDAIKVFGIRREQFALHVRTYEDIDQNKAIEYWRKVTGVPKNNVMSVEVLHGKKKGKLPYGMCRVRLLKGGYYLKLFTEIRKKIFEHVTNTPL